MITKISAFNFRNYDELSFHFNKNIVIFFGSHNADKTAILESIYFSTFEKSFRTTKLRDLIKKDKEHAYLSVEYTDKENKNNLISTNIKESVLQHLLNQKGASLKDFKNLSFPIYLDPSIIDIFNNNFLGRQDLIDNLISIDKKVYLTLVQDFKKRMVTFQNTKEIKSYHDTLKISLIDQLSSLEKEIVKLRKKFINKIKTYFIKNVHFYLQKEISFDYITKLNSSLDIKNGLNNKKINTILNDVFMFTYKGAPYENNIGIKEKNFLVILFFVSFLEYIQDEYNQEFPFLLNDVLKEIDENNYSLFFKLLKDKKINVFITSSNLNKFPINLLEEVQVIKM